MLNAQVEILDRLHRLVDIALTALAFYLAYRIKLDYLPQAYSGLLQGPDYSSLLFLILAIWYFCFWVNGVYASHRLQPLPGILWKCFKAITIGMLTLFMALYVFKIENISRILIGLFYLIDLLLIGFTKTGIYLLLRHYRLRGYNLRNLVILGCDHSAQEVIKTVAEERWTGYRVIGCLDDRQQVPAVMGENLRLIGRYADLKSILLNQVVDELVVTTESDNHPELDQYVQIADEMGITVRILPKWNIRKLSYIPQVGTLKYESFLGIPALGLDSTPANRGEIVFKMLIDYAIAIAGLVLTLPLWLLAAAGIKLVSPQGPVLYKQNRVGQNGREFTLYKFRTMIPDADRLFKHYAMQNECDGPVFKMKDDPRILPVVGPLLRKSSLDELPQLLNVLKGELSIVGPRPPLPREVKCYQYWQRRRLSMKPGLTCFWQIQPNRNDIGFNEWMKMDLAYIDNWSLWLDFKIILRTAWVMVTGNGR